MGCGASDFLNPASMLTSGVSKLMGSPNPPSSPDPYAVAGAQTQENQQASMWDIAHNRINQFNPFGSLTYDANGNQTMNLGPLGQNLMDQAQKGFASPLPDFNQSLANSFNIQKSMLDPVWDRNQNQLEAKLANQGVVQGSEAWDNAMKDFNMNKDYAYQNAQDHSISQAGDIQGLATQLRNLPMQELLAVQPNFNGYYTSSTNPANIGQYMYNNYQGQQDAYNQQVGMRNANVSALAQIGSAGAKAAMA